MNKELTIKFAELSDLPTIVDIYNQAIRTKKATGDSEEYVVNDRIGWFQKYNKNEYPIYVAKNENKVFGYCTLSPYRPGRKAFSTVAEISYYVDYMHHGKGIGTALLEHAISDCTRIGKESLLAILLDTNSKSIGILEKIGFEQWGYFPDIVKINGGICGHLIYGIKLDKT